MATLGSRRLGGGRWRGSGRLEGFAAGLLFFFAVLALDFREFVLDHAAKIGGCAAKIRQGFANQASHFRELFRTKNKQGDEKDDGEV